MDLLRLRLAVASVTRSYRIHIEYPSMESHFLLSSRFLWTTVGYTHSRVSTRLSQKNPSRGETIRILTKQVLCDHLLAALLCICYVSCISQWYAQRKCLYGDHHIISRFLCTALYLYCQGSHLDSYVSQDTCMCKAYRQRSFIGRINPKFYCI